MSSRDIVKEIAALKQLKTAQLRARYEKEFGEPTNSQNKAYLFKRIAYRLQEKEHGGLTDRAKQRAAELAKDAPIRRRPDLKGESDPAPTARAKTGKTRDPRLPNVGTVLKREYNGKEHTVKVLAESFEYRGKSYRSLSAIASEITKCSWNGFLFFGLAKKSA